MPCSPRGVVIRLASSGAEPARACMEPPRRSCFRAQGAASPASSRGERGIFLTEGVEPVGEREVQESHLGLEVGILDGAILACVKEELEVPVLEADLPEDLELFREFGLAGGTESTAVQ